MTNLVGITGQMGAGKDTVGEMIQELTEGYEIKKCAGKLKEIASILTGIPKERFEDQDFKASRLDEEWDDILVRHFLQRLGTEAIRDNVHPNAWINALFADYTPESKWIITDARFPNEFTAIRERGGKLIKILRDTGNESTHSSETLMNDWDEIDYVINNNGSISELREMVNNIVEQFKFVETGRTFGI